jgi:hypothetical protein
MKLSNIDFAGSDTCVRFVWLTFECGPIGVAAILFLYEAWLKSCVIVTMAGNVDYIAYFMAIKILFQPKDGQVPGRRNLIMIQVLGATDRLRSGFDQTNKLLARIVQNELQSKSDCLRERVHLLLTPIPYLNTYCSILSAGILT